MATITIPPEFIRSAEAVAAEAAAVARKVQYPDLEPDRFWMALRFFGYEVDLLAWVATLKDPESAAYDLTAWAAVSAKLEFAKYFERDHPFVVEAAVALGLLPAQLDDMWAWAAA